MDGSHALFADVRDTEEAERQAKVYETAMASIRRKEAASERMGLSVMKTMGGSTGIADSMLMSIVYKFLIAFVMIMPIIAMWRVGLS